MEERQSRLRHRLMGWIPGRHRVGEMGQRVRARDWSRTSVGAAEGWSQSLRTAVGMMLAIHYPMLIWWGEDLVQFYNDACIPVLGQRHPDALGRPAAEVWPEAWPLVGPRALAILQGGASSRKEELMMVMTGNEHDEGSAMPFTFGPIVDDDGAVGGVFAVCTQDRARGDERGRLATLRALAERLGQGGSPEAVCALAAEALVETAREVAFAHIYLFDAATQRVARAGVAGSVAPSGRTPGALDADDPRLPGPLWRALTTGAGVEARVGEVVDLGPHPGPEAREGAVVWPLRGPGEASVAGIAVLGVRPGVLLDEACWAFLEQAAHQVGAAVAYRSVTEALRARTEEVARLRRAAEEISPASERRYRALAGSFDVVYRASPDWTRIWGPEDGDALLLADSAGWLDAHVPGEDRQVVRAAVDEALRARQPFALEHRVEWEDGTVGWVASRAVPVEDDAGRLVEWIGAVNDITARKAHEGELFDERRRKEECLATLGHELRNPLASVRNAAELLRLLAPEDARLERVRRVLERQTLHMTRLVDGLLDLSRLARGKIRLDREALDAREIVEDVLQDRARELDAAGLELREDLAPAPVWSFVDRVRFAQVVDNLVGNAIKFTPSGGTIRVSFREEDGAAVLRVADTGVGMNPETIERLFEPFRQERRRGPRSSGGLGLGLALAKGLVEAHGGRIDARSAGLGQGAELRARFPRAAPPDTTPVAKGPEGAAMSRRILVVEDNPDAGETLRDLLEMLGHEVEVVEDGAAGLEALGRWASDVVLCDIGLPGISGYDLARLMRAHPELRATPLVAVTGFGQPEDRIRSAAAGFDAHLVKPVDLAQLQEVLGRAEASAARRRA